jgi:hypothetical protein
MPNPNPIWTCTACGQSVPNEPMTVFRHQMSHVQCRPLATNTPKDAEAEGDASERNIPLEDSYWSDLLS